MFSLRDPNPIISNVNSDRILAGWRCFLVRSLIWAIETYCIEACCHDSHEFHPVRCRGCNAHMQCQTSKVEACLTEIHLRNQILQMCHGFIGVITLATLQTERVYDMSTTSHECEPVRNRSIIVNAVLTCFN